ncbi:MAG: hypothetical protein JSR77_00505 [Planctomycetes bacterium]|nr:hypothetical protein [Planctomycetota bacterium]
MKHALVICLAASTAAAGVEFRVKFKPPTPTGPLTGRLVLSLVGPNAKILKGTPPNDAPFDEDPQPMYAVDVKNFDPAVALVVGDSADRFAGPVPSKLAPGKYSVQARLIVNRGSSNWLHNAMNLYSLPQTLEVTDRTLPADILVDKIVAPYGWPHDLGKLNNVDVVDLNSKLLEKFRGVPVSMQASIIKPIDYDPARTYPAVYEVPGFGGDHQSSLAYANAIRMRKLDAESLELHKNAFWIVLNPESPNGHTLFADSANNGPCGRMLVEELIPAIEAKYKMAATPAGRVLRGHSSGGWSTMWLAMNYPDTFGASWSTSPDPVDFRRLELCDIYGQTNMYRMVVSGVEPAGADDPISRGWKPPNPLTSIIADAHGFWSIPEGSKLPVLELGSLLKGNVSTVSVRTESQGEDIMGPNNTSGQQWDSWQAVWGPRGPDGNPAALYDPVTGAIDKSVAEQYRKYDIADLVRNNPEKYGKILRERVRLVVGTRDTFYLNEAVSLLAADLDRLRPAAHDDHGYIKFVDKADHGTVFGSPQVKAFHHEMLAHFRSEKLAP